MNCNGYMEHISAFCERKLAPEKVREVEAHVAECPKCAEFHRVAFEITCREAVELYEYLENTLSPERRAVFERHFAICPDCKNYLETYKATVRLSRAALAPEPASELPSVSEEFVRSILKRRKPS
ncbi:MAG: zf-HC2 domain-containing protein [Planctomycetes bacterium]|nr:zf-HC2 domain-containing protein [Planctomycetota bacterium]